MVVEALIQALTEQVISVVADEARFGFNLKSELDQMKSSLKVMNTILADADKKLPRDQKRMKLSLSKLREGLYEADNALTDCRIREQKKRKNRLCLCLLSLDPVFPLVMGRKLMKINSNMQGVRQEMDKYFNEHPPTPAAAAGNALDSSMSPHTDSGSSSGQYVGFEANIYGLGGDIDKLKGWILDGNDKEPVEMNYIGIVGMGGLGKTTLAHKLSSELKNSGHFDETIRVCVSRNFSIRRVIMKILERVSGGTSPSDSHGTDMILATLIKVLEGKSYLIILDDVWPNEKDPNWLKDLCSTLPRSVGKSSCIIITTRNADVAKNMVLRNTQIHYPKPLDNDDSWDLFCESAFEKYQGKCPSEQHIVDSKHILKKCGGLPLAIKTLGRLLSTKVESPAEWKGTSDKFHALTTEGKTVAVIDSLQLSYDELPHTSLKQCLLCVSIYPEDFEIPAEQLIHWWVGEGLVQEKNSKTAIELGYEYLADLVNRCLLEAVERRGHDGRVYTCKIHDMVREVIMKIAAEEAFCSFNVQGKLMQNDSQNNQMARWLCFSEDMDGDKKKLEDNPKLRTFFLMSNPPNNFGKSFGFLKSLRVLNLSYSKLENVVEDSTTPSPVMCIEDLFSCISSLKRLACLNLSGIQKLQKVPSSIQKLLNLQLLVLNGCINLVKIHPSIKCLKSLIVLDLGDCPLDYLPQGLGSLCLLQELTGFRVVNPAKTQGCTFRELGELKQLRVLEIVPSADIEISTDEIGILSSLDKLEVLRIDAEECEKQETMRMLDELKMPPNLKELYVRNYHSETMPNWFHPYQLSRLQYICVQKCDIKSLIGDESPWKTVEGLSLKSLSFVEDSWEKLSSIMPVLRYMEIRCCSEFKISPSLLDNRGVWTKQS